LPTNHLASPMSNWSQRIHQQLEAQKEKALWRSRLELTSKQSEHIEIASADQPLLNFCSNDYLGLAADSSDSLAKAAQQWGSGSGASHLVCGHSQAHHQLEQDLAAATGYERAILFSNGYMANMAIQQALLQKGDWVLHDKLNHASLIDGALLASSPYRSAGAAKFSRYLHCDVEALNSKLEKTDGANTLVMTDAVFSMDGDIAPLPELAQACQHHDALLMIDDAHGFGVLGAKGQEQGQGSIQHFGLTPNDVPIYMATLGKALGGYGAFVAGSDEMIEYLIQFARPYIYTTALPPALAETMTQHLAESLTGTRQKRLHHNIAHFKQLAQQAQLNLLASDTAIQPIIIGDDAKAMSISLALKAKGILVAAIRPPTVPAGTARLRVTITANHTSQDIQQLVDTLSDVVAEIGNP